MKSYFSRSLCFSWLLLSVSCAATYLLPGSLSAAQSAHSTFTYFRSDAGNAAPEVGKLPDDLNVPGALRWRAAADSGHSTPAIAGGKVFVTTYRAEDHELATVAFNEATGQMLWKQTLLPARVEEVHPSMGNPASATPACDGQRLFVFFGSAGLICYDLDGHKLWEVALGPFQDEYGAGSSPVLVDDKVILCEDHDLNSFLLALDRTSGKVIWKVPRPDAVRSYSTPALWEHNGRKELLVGGALELAAFDPSSGEKLWWAHGLARIVIPVPVPAGDMIYMASWTPGGDPGQRLALDPWPAALAKWDRNHDGKLTRSEIDNREVLDRFYRMDLDQSGDLDQHEWERHAEVFRRAQNALLALKPSGSGDLTDKALVWKYQRAVPYVATPVVHEGIVWMVKDGGIVTKLDAKSGEVLQTERLPGLGGYYASPVVGDGKVFFASEQGKLSIVASEREWRLLSSYDFHEKIYATPVLVRRGLCVRTEKALYSFALPSGPK